MPPRLLELFNHPAPRWLRFASLALIHSLVGLALFLLASLLPLAGWHRLYFKARGWWLMPLTYLVASATGHVILSTQGTLRPWMLLLSSGCLALLWVHECHFILQASPRLARERIAVDAREVIRG